MFLITNILSYMPITSEAFTPDQADLSLYNDATRAPAPPSFIVAKTSNLLTEFGEPHGRALVLYSAENGSATYLIKEYLKAQHGMMVRSA